MDSNFDAAVARLAVEKQMQAAARKARRRTYKDAWYPSPISLPERTVGRFSIKHRVMTGELPVVGTRQAFNRGIRPCVAVTEKPLTIHELHEDDHGVWMTDQPEELNQIYEMLHDVKPKGRVLVGGLGLGILTRLIIFRPGVTHVTTVELNQDVIELAAPKENRSRETSFLRHSTVCSDIFAFLAGPQHEIPFDHYLLDTWGGTNESTWWGTVLPLRRAIRQRWGSKPKIHCWAEDIMWGQVERSLLRPHARHWHHQNLPAVMSATEVRRFQLDAGLPAWEKKYGAAIDAVTKGD